MNGVTILAAGLWTAYLITAVGSGATTALAAPLQRQIAAAAAVSMLVLLVLAKPSHGQRGDRLSLLVHALPLILLLRLGGGGSWAERTLSPSVWTQLAHALTASAPLHPQEDDTDRGTLPLDEVLRSAQVGQTLSTSGRISRAPDDVVLPPGPWQQSGLVLLYQFRMMCCAADATPVAVLAILDGELPPTGAWIALQGQVRGRYGGDGSVLMLEAVTWAEQAAPAQTILIGPQTPSLY